MKHTDNRPWDVWIDTGGTFTDCMARDPDRRIHRAKVPSSGALRFLVHRVSSPGVVEVRDTLPDVLQFYEGFMLNDGIGGSDCPVESSETRNGLTVLRFRQGRTFAKGEIIELLSPFEAPVLGIRVMLAAAPGSPLPPVRLRVATTRGTNALLERKGSPPVLVVTRGFRDLVEIGNQQRPDLFALDIKKPIPLHTGVATVAERLAADGSVLLPLDEAEFRTTARDLVSRGQLNAAVAFVHSYCNPSHEHMAAEILRTEGFQHVSVSSHLSPMIKLLDRAETAIVDAYVAPIMKEYLENIVTQLGSALESFHVMTSAGGLSAPASFRACDSLLSGPAGGTIGASMAGKACGFTKLIAFDMGGTSTDVSRYSGSFDYVFEHRIGDARVNSPVLAIETVAAGGGSICGMERGQAFVGPHSAGANPGPACYGGGGPLTITDVNLLLGRLDPSSFAIPVSPDAARARFTELLDTLGLGVNPEQLLEGFLSIVNERMADAIQTISVRQGYDPSTHALVAFGGAGPQHACAVAELLGIGTIVVPPDAGLLSARGLAAARIERFAERQVLLCLEDFIEDPGDTLTDLEAAATRAVALEGVAQEQIRIARRLFGVRFAGQEATLTVECTSVHDVADEFMRLYRKQFQYDPGNRPIELVWIRVIAAAQPEQDTSRLNAPVSSSLKQESRDVQMFLDGTWQAVRAVPRALISPLDFLIGPAIITEAHCVTIVESGWRAGVDPSGALLLRRHQEEYV